MNDQLLLAVLNAPLAIRRFLALLFLTFASCAMAVLVWLPLHVLQSARSDLIQQREQLGKLEQILSTASQATPEPQNSANRVFLSGESEGGMQASLQQRLSALMRSKPQNLTAVGPAPTFEASGVSYIGITANVLGSHEELSNLIFELETATPPLLIRSARLSARQSLNAANDQREQTITAQLSIFGAVDPKKAE